MPVERTAYTNAPSKRRSLANTACHRWVGLMVRNVTEESTPVLSVLCAQILTLGLVLGRAVDRGHLAAGHPQIHGELTAMVDHVVQHEPQKVLAAHVAELFWSSVKLDRRVQMPVVHFPNFVCHLFERALYLAERALPVIRHFRHLRRRELELPLDRGGASHPFDRECPRQLSGAAAGVMRLHVFLRTGIGPENLQRGRRLTVPGA